MWFRKTHKQLQLSFPLQCIRSLDWLESPIVEFLAAAVIRYRICRSELQTGSEKNFNFQNLYFRHMETLSLFLHTLNPQFEQII